MSCRETTGLFLNGSNYDFHRCLLDSQDQWQYMVFESQDTAKYDNVATSKDIMYVEIFGTHVWENFLIQQTPLDLKPLVTS